MKPIPRVLRSVAYAAAVVVAGLLMAACEGEAKGPPQPMSTPGGQPYAPKTGSGGTQYGVAETLPLDSGATEMNAQAAALYSQGLAAFSQADLKQAQAFFLQATQADPKAFQAFYSLGVVQERLGAAGARSSYQKSFTIVPKYHRAASAYGLLLAKRGDLSEADAFLTERRGKYPKSAVIAAALAEVKSLQKDSASAQHIAQQALKIDPGLASAMMTIARDHYRNRRLDLALYALKAVLDGFGSDSPPRDKDNAEGHLLRAFIWAEQGKRVIAMEAFKKALGLRPDLVVARLRLATFLLESGAADEALPMLQTAIKFDSDNLNAHLSLGDAYRLTGQYQAAKQEFEWVKSRDSSQAEVHYNLGLLYLFAPNVPGMKARQQVMAAISSFNRYKELRGKAADDSDVDELLNRAKLKKSEMEALEAAKHPKPVKAAPAAASASAAASAKGSGK